jgi:hypothetical protein
VAEGIGALPGSLSPVFIVPAMGCETALLARLLDHHPQVHAPAACVHPEVDTPEAAHAFVAAQAQQAVRDATMSLRRGGQSPLHTFCMTIAPGCDMAIDRLLRAFPSAHTLCPIRDGRDAIIEDRLASLRAGEFAPLSRPACALAAEASAFHSQADLSLARRSSPSQLFCPESLRLHTMRWIESLRAPMRARELVHGQARFIRHEDLLIETIRTHAATCRWLGVAGDAAHVHSAIEACRPQLAAAQRPGAWRTILSEADKAAFKRMAGELLIELGFAQDTRW